MKAKLIRICSVCGCSLTKPDKLPGLGRCPIVALGGQKVLLEDIRLAEQAITEMEQFIRRARMHLKKGAKR